MASLTTRLETASRALATLEEIVPPAGAVERDAAIQRFEYTVEATWKAARAWLVEVEGVAAASPKRVARECRASGVLDDAEAARALAMVDDRNLTSHTYHEGVAAAIASRLQGHVDLLRRWLEELRRRTP